MRNDLNVQIIGTKKNAATRKAIRFFTDRGLKPHVVDLNERGLKRRELENVSRGLDPIVLIDAESAVYRKGGYAYMDFDPIEELLEKPLLLKMPVVRCAGRVAVGERPEEWARWLEE